MGSLSSLQGAGDGGLGGGGARPRHLRLVLVLRLQRLPPPRPPRGPLRERGEAEDEDCPCASPGLAHAARVIWVFGTVSMLADRLSGNGETLKVSSVTWKTTEGLTLLWVFDWYWQLLKFFRKRDF